MVLKSQCLILKRDIMSYISLQVCTPSTQCHLAHSGLRHILFEMLSVRLGRCSDRIYSLGSMDRQNATQAILASTSRRTASVSARLCLFFRRHMKSCIDIFFQKGKPATSRHLSLPSKQVCPEPEDIDFRAKLHRINYYRLVRGQG